MKLHMLIPFSALFRMPQEEYRLQYYKQANGAGYETGLFRDDPRSYSDIVLTSYNTELKFAFESINVKLARLEMVMQQNRRHINVKT